ncbi:MAG: tetratricopeptide repeat protein [Chloroflexota bacterium]
MESKSTLERAIEEHKAGHRVNAEAAYRRILERQPGHPDALNFLGMLRCQAGDPTEAAQLLRRSVEAEPSNPHAWLNLGNVLVIAGNQEEARTAFTRATELAPNLAMTWFNLGVCLGRCKQPREAASALHRALKVEPGYLPAYEYLAHVLYRMGNFAEASEVYQEWLVYDPENPVARHMLAATSGTGAPSRAANDYVRHLFDDFAESFDERLASLQYRAPQLVAQRLERDASGDAGLNILDAGCGTGLCGPLVKPLASHLVGVDLSVGMIDKARARGAYDELAVAELCEFMRSRAGTFDVVVSADTLVYFGDLEEPLRAARKCLRRGGRVIFTVERLDSTRDSDPQGPSYHLETHGRYSHAEGYVCGVLEAAGFAEVTIDSVILRRERGQEVVGLIVLARAA